MQQSTLQQCIQNVFMNCEEFEDSKGETEHLGNISVHMPDNWLALSFQTAISETIREEARVRIISKFSLDYPLLNKKEMGP